MIINTHSDVQNIRNRCYSQQHNVTNLFCWKFFSLFPKFLIEQVLCIFIKNCLFLCYIIYRLSFWNIFQIPCIFFCLEYSECLSEFFFFQYFVLIQITSFIILVYSVLDFFNPRPPLMFLLLYQLKDSNDEFVIVYFVFISSNILSERTSSLLLAGVPTI